MKKIFSSPYIHPFFFAAYPVVFLFAENIKTLQTLDLFIPLMIVEIVAFTLILFFKFIYRNIYKASIVASYVLIVGLSYMYIYDFLKSTVINFILKGNHIPLYVLFVLLFIYILYSLKKTTRTFHSLTPILNIVSFTLLIFPFLQIFQFHFSYSQSNKSTYSVNLPVKKKSVTKKRDVYYFIFDRYAREDTLKDYYSYDNSPFTHFLSSKGFYVAPLSQANYISTELSITSSLNGVHLDDFIATVGSQSSNLRPLHQILEDYKLLHFFKDQGYTYIHLGSWWAPTSLNRFADQNINVLSLTEFGESIFANSFLYPIFDQFEIPLFNTRYTNWKRIVYQFDMLKNIPDNDKPTFVFGHFLLPHPPYVFDKNGKYMSEKEARSRDNKTNFVEQVQYTNSQIEKLVTTILSHSKDPKPIIIIQADEGPYPSRYEDQAKSFDWSKSTMDERKEKMQILNAYYLPDGGDKLLYPSISPVNTFRVVLNYYFGQKLPYLPDISYYSNKGKPYSYSYIEEAQKKDSSQLEDTSFE